MGSDIFKFLKWLCRRREMPQHQHAIHHAYMRRETGGELLFTKHKHLPDFNSIRKITGNFLNIAQTKGSYVPGTII